MAMDPRLAPPAPPPLQPITPSHNPYDFITQPPGPKKSGLLGVSSKKNRIILVVIVLLVLSLLAVIVVAVLGQSGNKLKADYLSLAQQQAELIRISDIGVSKASRSEVKNAAVNTKLSLLSDQPATLGLAKKAGVKADAKTLNLGKDEKVDAALTAAVQTNQFDAVFIKTISQKLKQYQETLKRIYDATTSQSSRNTLSKSYKNAETLIKQQQP